MSAVDCDGLVSLGNANSLQRDPNEPEPSELEEYHRAKQIKLPSQVPASAGGLNKTSRSIYIY